LVPRALTGPFGLFFWAIRPGLSVPRKTLELLCATVQCRILVPTLAIGQPEEHTMANAGIEMDGKLGRPLDILLVEDNPADMRLTQEALKEGKVFCKLHWVKDGVEAMDFLHRRGEFEQATRPDLILLDLNLPRMDGREVLASIKADTKLRRIPVVILTTSKAEEDIIRSYDLYANCYMTKYPVDLDSFIEVIRSIDRFWLALVSLPPKAEN
jgi:CheY-like chemotaxis protein